ncbi:MAG: hypothetical protein WA071_27985 [Undibacterium umbellatum]|uniref:hypothetical protein n=1 Tax=Undibacterium umbellatum TaxID=2762300 RepID=UPI003BB5B5EA
MTNLINSVKHAIVAFQIKRLDRRYIKLSRDLDWYDQQLQVNRMHAEQNRLKTMIRRNRLRAALIGLEGR